jgi:hypothetical protein
MGDLPRLRVMIQCPQSSRAIFTGRLARQNDFEADLAGKNAVGCSECGELHLWEAGQAWLEQDAKAAAAMPIAGK